MTEDRIYRPDAAGQKRVDTFLASCRIPPALERAVEAYLAKKTGKPFDDPVTLERLRRSIVAQKDEYWKAPARRKPAYGKGYSVLAYLAYHFPVYFMQAQYLMRDLAAAGLLKKDLRVLDVGTGPGVVPLAIAGFCSRAGGISADIHSIEQSEEHIEAFRFLAGALVPETGPVTVRVPVQADLCTVDSKKIPGTIDLLVFSNVINELEGAGCAAQADLVMRYASHVAQDGTILLIEPAEMVTATRLRSISLALVKKGLAIHSPCSFLYGTRCNPSRCWSFVTQPEIYPTRLMDLLSSGSEPYRYINTDIKYAYVVLRKDGAVRYGYRIPQGTKAARLSKLHLHTERRINIIAAKMSGDLGNAGTHVYKLCDGTAVKPVYAVLPAYNMSRSNGDLIRAPYGTILEFRQVTARYNKRHDAYNMLIGKDTAIRQVTG
jgi:hypothetical protein